MKIEKIVNSKMGLVIGAGVVGLIVVGYSAKKAADAVDSVGQALNPVDDGNIFNQGVLAVGRKITGNQKWSLGGWIYDITH